MMTQEEMVLRLGQMDRELDRVEDCRRVGNIGEAMQRLTAAVRLQLSVLRPVAVAVLPGEKQEAPKAVEAPQDDHQVRALAIVTDDQVRALARECGRQPAVCTMLMNAAHTIEHLSGLVCQQTKVLRTAQQEIADMKKLRGRLSWEN